MYLDPGFGGMLIQGLVLLAAVGGGILFAIRKKIRNIFSRDKDKHTEFTAYDAVNSDTEDAVDILDDEENKEA